MLTYAVDLFDDATMRLFGERLGRMLAAVATDPESVIGDVPLLDPAERTEVLEAWNEPGTRVPDVTLVDRFREAAEAHPDSVAVTFGDRQLTYAELSARVNRLARELVDRGVRPDTLVGVALPRTEELVVALLAVQQAGGGYLPIDLTYPAERLTFMLEDAAPVCVLVAGEPDALPATDVPVIDLERLDLSTRSADPLSDDERAAPLRSDNLAYVIYTSGSTGRPKGVQIPHRTVLELFENTAPAFGFDADDVWTVPLLRLRLLRVGTVGSAAPRWSPRGRRLPHLPVPGGLPRPPAAREDHGAQPDPVGLLPARRGGRRCGRAGSGCAAAVPAVRRVRW